jgi:hypothetical protein
MSREQCVRQKINLLIASAKIGVEELQEAREAEQTAQNRKRCETDDRIPLVSFRDAIANPQLHRSIAAANPPAADEIDFALGSLIQVHTDQRCYRRIDDRFIGSGVEQAVA